MGILYGRVSSTCFVKFRTVTVAPEMLRTSDFCMPSMQLLPVRPWCHALPFDFLGAAFDVQRYATKHFEVTCRGPVSRVLRLQPWAASADAVWPLSFPIR